MKATTPTKAQSGRDIDQYRYDTFRAGLMLNDARFSPEALKPGQLLTDQTLVRPDGTETSLRALAKDRPLLLVTGSLTCPLSISTLPIFSELDRRYGDRIAFAFVYTREAHPGERIGQPATLAKKAEHARLLQETYAVGWPLLVDDLAGTLHRKLDTKQNSIHIFATDNRLVFRALFAGDPAVEKAILAIARGEQPHKSQGLGKLSGPMRSIGYIEETLRPAGSKAYRDVVKALPPMAMMAALTRAFTFLPKARRGWAAAGTLMVGIAAVMVGLFSLLA